jgi:hypothetical protein
VCVCVCVCVFVVAQFGCVCVLAQVRLEHNGIEQAGAEVFKEVVGKLECFTISGKGMPVPNAPIPN